MTQTPVQTIPLAFVLLDRPELPEPQLAMRTAQDLGISLQGGSVNDGMMSLELAGGGNVMVAMIAAPHPDAPGMPTGPTSPDPATLARSAAHLIVTIVGLPPSSVTDQDILVTKLTTAVIRASSATAAMLGHGVMFHRAEVFDAVASASDETILAMVCVDITAAPEPDDRVSFLTHGLTRYGREEFYVTASVRGKGALDYVMGMTNWMLTDRSKVLPTGDTVGRTADEKIVVQRVASPIAGAPAVIRLDMDTESSGLRAQPSKDAPKKRSWFKR